MDLNRTICPKRTGFVAKNQSFTWMVLVFRLSLILVTLLSYSCASLLPKERRVYPKNPIHLPAGMDIHEWVQTKKEQYPNRLRVYDLDSNSYKIQYFRRELTSIGSFISCAAYLRQTNTKSIEMLEMIFNVNYADYHKSMIPRGGELGPMNEKERAEILLPCIEEFLTPPQTKE
ncbi:hypothetical protein [Leptospira bouyouniensis]|uniref:hypothetical protein n=1 Tax=Leptospira bouyouniensis TaxID=2484911 RepID=UPI001FC92298|nr:hypothetical protein [Leptospira bouyouniensis]